CSTKIGLEYSRVCDRLRAARKVAVEETFNPIFTLANSSLTTSQATGIDIRLQCMSFNSTKSSET
ncbi:1113_t:CDS:1, partial [Acaulospora colombiana]